MVHVDGVEDAETTCYIEVAFLMIAWTHLNQTNAPVSKFTKPRKWWSSWRNQNHVFVFEYCNCTALSLGFPHRRTWKPWLPLPSSVIRPSQQWKALQIKQLQVLYGPGHSTGVDWSWPRQWGAATDGISENFSPGTRWNVHSSLSRKNPGILANWGYVGQIIGIWYIIAYEPMRRVRSEWPWIWSLLVISSLWCKCVVYLDWMFKTSTEIGWLHKTSCFFPGSTVLLCFSALNREWCNCSLLPLIPCSPRSDKLKSNNPH